MRLHLTHNEIRVAQMLKMLKMLNPLILIVFYLVIKSQLDL